MRVLWLCNIVLPELCDIFGFKRTNVGGWLTGMWTEMKKQSDLQLGICLPIMNRDRMKDGEHENYKYYSFLHVNDEDFLEEQSQRFIEIIEDFQPDIIHIWGTEYMHSLSMINAAEKLELLNKTVINIQGLIGIYAIHYANNIPQHILEKKVDGKSINDVIEDFSLRSKFEKVCLQKVKHVIGRTTWDRACVKQINSKIEYHFCGEILRPEIYINANTWTYELCEKNTIFISQASYPIKGFHTFIKGMAIIKEQFSDVKVYVAGQNLLEVNNSYARYILDLIDEHNLDNNIQFLGMINAKQMCEYLKRCNVFVSASSIENSPNSVCEALMIGTPIVASNVGGVSDLIRHGENGYLYPYDEYYMMAYYVSQIFENKDNVYQKLSNGSENKMLKINCVSENSMQNLSIYKKLLNKR